MKTLVSNVRVPVSALAEIVYSHSKYLRTNFEPSDLSEDGDEENAGGDIRLQVLPGIYDTPGSWRTWSGDSQYDTDSRGFWGTSFVPYRCTHKQALEIARELIDDAQESFAMSGE